MHLQAVISAPAAVLCITLLIHASLAQEFGVDPTPDRVKETAGETFEIAVSSISEKPFHEPKRLTLTRLPFDCVDSDSRPVIYRSK